MSAKRERSPQDYRRPYTGSKVSLLYVRTAMANRPSHVWTIEELCEVTNRPSSAVAIALAVLVEEGSVCRSRAYIYRVDVDGEKKVWMLRPKTREGDVLIDAQLDQKIEAMRSTNQKLRDMIDWLVMCGAGVMIDGDATSKS